MRVHGTPRRRPRQGRLGPRGAGERRSRSPRFTGRGQARRGVRSIPPPAGPGGARRSALSSGASIKTPSTVSIKRTPAKGRGRGRPAICSRSLPGRGSPADDHRFRRAIWCWFQALPARASTRPNFQVQEYQGQGASSVAGRIIQVGLRRGDRMSSTDSSYRRHGGRSGRKWLSRRPGTGGPALTPHRDAVGSTFFDPIHRNLVRSVAWAKRKRNPDRLGCAGRSTSRRAFVMWEWGTNRLGQHSR